jgi:HTH-type transcriptional regulator / antitoxin HigA
MNRRKVKPLTPSAGTNRFEPDYVVPPGDTLSEVLEERSMTQAELSRRTGLSTKHINQIVAGEATISPETALKLERVTRVPARFWTQLEAVHQEQRSRRLESETLQADVDWLRELPVKQLVDRGWIEQKADRVDQLREVLTFFGVASRAAWETVWNVPTAYRKSRAFESDLHALATWLRIGELQAANIVRRPFNARAFRSALGDIRGLTRIEDPQVWLPALQQTCAEHGVAVVIEKEISGARINGAVRWLAPDQVLIELSLRHGWADIFWFTFFHEAGHVVQHERKRLTFVDGKGAKQGELEEEADAFASRMLIPHEFDEALGTLGSSADKVRDFADRLGLGPGIVVGRLQHEGLLGHQLLNKLRVRYAFTDK